MLITNQQRKILKKIVATLDKSNIPYEVTGGVAALFYGARRPLYDIDIDIHKTDFPKNAINKSDKLYANCQVLLGVLREI